LLLARASEVGQEVYVEPINPFANKGFSTEDRIVLKRKDRLILKQSKMEVNPLRQRLAI